MNKGIIYMIKCKDPNIKESYIGSTVNLELRKQKHEFCCMDGTSKVYQFIRENKGFDNFEFEILEDNIEFNIRKELNKIERYYIEELKSNLNSQIPTRTLKEWRITNKDKIKEYDKIKNQTEKRKEYDIIRNQTEKRKEYAKMYNKKYKEENKEKKKELDKIYREKNKININCNCGSIISKLNYSTHCKTKKHLQYIENNN